MMDLWTDAENFDYTGHGLATNRITPTLVSIDMGHLRPYDIHLIHHHTSGE
jgi:hypothetical protein